MTRAREPPAAGGTRIQLCGRLVARLGGCRLEEGFPGRQGRVLFAYLVLNRLRPAPRGELVEALWPRGAPAAAGSALAALLSRLRAVVGPCGLEGRAEVRLALEPGAWVDVEAAGEAIHRAESAVALGDWAGAWGPSRVALNVASRPLLPGADAPWLDDARRRLEDVRLRAFECIGASGLGLGGPELAAAERSARALVEAAPFRESGWRLLMESLAARGNVAEALLAHDRLRTLLRDELGIAPGHAVQELHRRLLAGRGDAEEPGRPAGVAL